LSANSKLVSPKPACRDPARVLRKAGAPEADSQKSAATTGVYAFLLVFRRQHAYVVSSSFGRLAWLRAF
jgi:hypothetical protein